MNDAIRIAILEDIIYAIRTGVAISNLFDEVRDAPDDYPYDEYQLNQVLNDLVEVDH